LAPQFDFPICKEVFIDISLLLHGPNFTIVIIPAQISWSF